ncbi:MAG: endo-1,4-beta-xylanase [Thermoguttaceae bacterium]|nr:endo-1,4-beta-xylanase [Thermoguttaceae bacterium]
MLSHRLLGRAILSVAAVAIVASLAVTCQAKDTRKDQSGSGYPLDRSVMNEKYWEFWNDEVQKKIDADIEKNRKADAKVELPGVKPGSDVTVKQLTHKFRFGSNIFLFGQFDTPEKNKAYADAYGDLFNAATVAFYWKTLEPTQGKPRFTADSEFIARRPPTDPVIDYCLSRGLSIHGHAIIYAFPIWGHPEWLPADRKAMEPFFEKHVKELAERYGNKVAQWDVVNESYDQCNRGLVPDDYVYKTFQWSEKYFPKTVRFSCNDSNLGWPIKWYNRYVEIVRDLRDRGVRVDLIGMQAHTFDAGCRAIAQGKPVHTPEKIYEILDAVAKAELPIHISEVTVAAPTNDEKGRQIQAIIAKNFYRLWFSYEKSDGITWWNAVDGGAAAGESSYSGIFTSDLKKKPVYFALDDLFNRQWRTNLTMKPTNSTISFRGFRGKYLVSWTDTNGKRQEKKIEVQ